jgi:Domain of unknown function (DUF4062)
MEKRYQVFVSSTFDDLQEERRNVISVLISMNCFPAAMEFFQASDEDQWSLIKRVIDECDYYIVIVGARYGSIDEKSGLSFTEKEYDYAIAKDKPVIGFFHGDPDKIPQGKSEKTEVSKPKLEAFRAKVQKKMCKSWTSPAELGLAVSLSMPRLMQLRPSPGWISGAEAADPARENDLRKKIEQLEASLKEVNTQAPAGTSDLAQGDDNIIVQLTLYSEQSNQLTPYSIQSTWNDLFKNVGSYLLQSRSEDDIKTCLAEGLTRGMSNFTASISQSECDIIKLQFYALGLITRGAIGHMWSLTPYGESALVRIGAIKKSS